MSPQDIENLDTMIRETTRKGRTALLALIKEAGLSKDVGVTKSGEVWIRPRGPRPGPHKHKCGFDTQDPTMTGCGHEWDHDTASIEQMDDYLQAHYCPQCGKGPWGSPLRS